VDLLPVSFDTALDAARRYSLQQAIYRRIMLLASGADLHTYTIVAVRPGSPAEADGFQRGDVISGEDGKNASEFALRELRDSLSHAGKHHTLDVQRGGERQTTNVVVRLVSIEH
jgi:S1-C subfamily serine protease